MKRLWLGTTVIVILGILGALFFMGKIGNQNAKTTQNKSSSNPSNSQKSQISGMVVPHHDLVKAERVKLFETVAGKIPEPKTVILVSPNHDNVGEASIQTSDQSWPTASGEIQPAKEVIDDIINQKVADNEPSSFHFEHGIRLILGDIKNHFPNSTLVPLIFKSNTDMGNIQSLHDRLHTTCTDCLLIASVDFSHYQPALQAQLHDIRTERLLKLSDAESLYKTAEIDSPSALALLALWATSHETKRFELSQHTNSGILTSNADIPTTTHMFGWYEAGETNVPETSVTFLIGGDMMFGRSIAHTFLAGGLWKSLEKLGDRAFWGVDAGIANLEGPVSDVPVPDNIQPNNLVFNFPPETISSLKYLHLSAVSLANNHTQNKGSKGLATTRRLLDEAGIKWIGGPNDEDVPKTQCFAGYTKKLCVIGVHLLASQPDVSNTIKTLKAEPNTHVLVFPHWGAEYQPKHGASQAKLAHAWIDAGADIVIGAHPHVIQDAEVYNGKPIFYSLGNLLFDQDFSRETQEGLLIGGKFTDKALEIFALPTQSTKYQPALAGQPTKGNLLDALYKPLADYRTETPAGVVYKFPFE
jgi:poly-gamma-glutamate synthesis protein (capsule biosynthesis protein)